MNIALDVDGVLADFVGTFATIAHEMGYNLPRTWQEWHAWDAGNPALIKEIWAKVADWPTVFASLKSMPDASVPFQPTAYMTSRPVSSVVTADWLAKYHFPTALVVTVGLHQDKLKHCQDMAIDFLVDDRADTAIYFRDNGGECVLLNRPWNVNESTDGIHRIDSLSEVVEWTAQKSE